MAQIFTINQTSSITSYFIIARLEPDLGDYCYLDDRKAISSVFFVSSIELSRKMHFIFDYYNQSVNSCAGQLLISRVPLRPTYDDGATTERRFVGTQQVVSV